MKKLALMALPLVVLAVMHEGTHALVASAYGEYQAFHVRPFGLEVTYVTPVHERHGLEWAWIAGLPSVVTLLIGYLLFSARGRIASFRQPVLRHLGYYAIVLFLLADPLNLSIGSLIYGGDAPGVAVGLSVSLLAVQAFFLVTLLVNRELIVRKLFPLFDIHTRHPLFRPIRLKRGSA